MKTLTVSAPGKLLLMGDHAVVYGWPCLTTAVDRRLSVTLEECDAEGVVFDTPDVPDTRFLSAAIAVFEKRRKQRVRGVTIRTSSDFSGTVGLGSSAAVSVAVVAALCDWFGAAGSLREIFAMAYASVLDVQGVGSGFDVAASAYGGTLWYEKTGKTIERLDVTNMPLVVGYTGIKADTPSIVKSVADKRLRDTARVDRLFEGAARLVVQAKEKFADGDWERVGKLMDFNQEYLRDLGVSSERLETLISAAKGAGAWGAKLSGAGGGDCMIALVPDSARAAVEHAIEQAGGKVIHIKPNAPGVRKEP